MTTRTMRIAQRSVLLLMCLAASVHAAWAAALVGTATTTQSLYSSSHFYAHHASGHYWLAFHDGIRPVLYSSHDAVTWQPATTAPGEIFTTFNPATQNGWSVRFSGNNIVAFGYRSGDGNHYYRNAVLNGDGTATWNTTPETSTGAATSTLLNALIANAKPILWQAGAFNGGAFRIGSQLNSPGWVNTPEAPILSTGTPGAGSNGGFSVGAVFQTGGGDPNDLIVIRATTAIAYALGSHRLVAIKYNAVANAFDGSWFNVSNVGGIAENSTSEPWVGVDGSMQRRFAAVRDTTGNIHAVYCNRDNDIVHYKKTVGFDDNWSRVSAGINPLAETIDKVALTALANDNLMLYYSKNNQSIWSRRFDGTSWSAESAIKTTANDFNQTFGAMESATGSAGVAWSEDPVSPYDVFFSLSPTTNYRSIGTAPDDSTGSVTTTTGSPIVDGVGTSWLAINRGRGDVISICDQPLGTCTTSTDYTVLGVGSDLQLRLTTAYTGSTGNHGYTIRRQFRGGGGAGNGGQALIDWENCVDGGPCAYFGAGITSNLVTDNRKEVGIAYEDSVFGLTAAEFLIQGSTTDADHSITLTADGINRHNGYAGMGVIVDSQAAARETVIFDANVTIEWLEFKGLRGGDNDGLIRAYGASAKNIVLQNLLIHDFYDPSPTPYRQSGIRLSDVAGKSVTVRNVMIWDGDQAGIRADEVGDTLTIENCSIDNMQDATTSRWGVYADATPGVIVRNTIATRSGIDFAFASGSFAAGPTSTNNISSDGTAPGNNPLIALATNLFVNPGIDLHLKAGAAAIDAGVSLAPSFYNDVDGGVRPGGLGWDRGADESGVTTEVRLQSFAALAGDGSVVLEWRTASELHNLGFHLYRGLAESGPWTRLTTSLIPGLGSSATGQAYSYRDGGLVNGTRYFYRLDDVDAASKATSHGPVSAVPVAGGSGGAPGSEPPGSSPSGTRKGTSSQSCPDWVAAAYGSTAGASASTATLRCTRHGSPEAVSLDIVSRAARSATLELRTGGFYALHEASGRVHVFVPGFDFPRNEQAAALPVRRALVDAVVGRRVQLAGARALELQGFDGLVPSVLGKAEMQVSGDGTVRVARRGSAGAPEHFPSSELATLLPSVFQGETKSAVVEIAPLRFDSQRRQLMLARRVRVRLLFTGRETGESGRGRFGRKERSRKPLTEELLARFHTTSLGLHAVAFEQVFPGRRRGLAASELRLERQGEAVGFHLEPVSDSFGPGGALYFHSDTTAASSAFSPEIAWELVRSGDGLRMPLVSAAPTGGAVSSTPLGTASFEVNRFYQPGLLEAPELWLWEGLASGATRAKSFSLAGMNAASPLAAELEVFLQGASESGNSVDHHVSVSLNGVLVGEARFAGKKPYRISLSLPASLLRDGANELSLTNVADTGVSSLVFLDRFSVVYPQMSALTSGVFEGTWSESGTATVLGVTGPVALLDLTSGRASWLQAHDSTGGSLRFRAEAGHRYRVVSREALLGPRVALPQASTLRSAANQADYLLIAPRAFLAAAEPLVSRRQDQGLVARGVAFEEIASEFGHGQPSAEAIRDFLAFAFHSWARPSPRYVLLLGDSSYDPRNFSSSSQPSPLPALWSKTSFLWTASDPELAAVNGEDELPDLAIGRLPAATVEQAQTLVDKLIAWEDSGQGLAGRASLVADNPDLAGDFEANARDIALSFLAGRSEVLLLRELGAETRPRIQAALDSGLSFLSYVGHGGAAVWGSENVWNSWDAAGLRAQSQQPLLLTLDCLNGYFVAPAFDSLAESLLKAEGRGVIAAFSPSGLSLDGPAHQYHRALMAEVTSGRHQRLGDALAAAQKDYAQGGLMPELLSIYHLLGDPATRIR